MNSKIARIDAELGRRIAEIINTKLNDPRLKGGFISVTSVNTTIDLKQSKVYVSMFNIDDVQGALKVINNAQGYIRNEVKNTLDIRNMPTLKFYLDTSIEYGMKIDKLLEDIKNNDNK